MPLHWLFPTPVMQVDLTPDDGIAAAMHQQLEVFDRDMFGDPQFSNRNNLTGDLLGIAGLDQLHRMDAFFWLNQQIAEQVSLYLIDLLGPNHGLEVHIQKAWPLVILDDPNLYTLPLGLQQLSSSFSLDWRIVAAGSVVSILPVMALFLLLQRFILPNASGDAVKG